MWKYIKNFKEEVKPGDRLRYSYFKGIYLVTKIYKNKFDAIRNDNQLLQSPFKKEGTKWRIWKPLLPTKEVTFIYPKQ